MYKYHHSGSNNPRCPICHKYYNGIKCNNCVKPFKINTACIYCGSTRVTKREKNYVRCLACRRSFILGSDKSTYFNRQSDAFLSIVASKSVIKFSARAIKLMCLSEGDKVAFKIDEQISIQKNERGFEVRSDGGRLVFNRSSLLTKIREQFNLDFYKSYRIKGQVKNGAFLSMEIIDTTNAPRRNGGLISKTSFILINKHHSTVRFSKKTVDMMMIEHDDKVIIGKEKNKIFIALSDSEKAFHITYTKHSSANCTSTRFGAAILEHFNLSNSNSHRITVKEESVNKNGLTFFELIYEPEI